MRILYKKVLFIFGTNIFLSGYLTILLSSLVSGHVKSLSRYIYLHKSLRSSSLSFSLLRFLSLFGPRSLAHTASETLFVPSILNNPKPYHSSLRCFSLKYQSSPSQVSHASLVSLPKTSSPSWAYTLANPQMVWHHRARISGICSPTSMSSEYALLSIALQD